MIFKKKKKNNFGAFPKFYMFLITPLRCRLKTLYKRVVLFG